MTEQPHQAIRKEFDRLLARVDEGDTLVVALSGHGVQFKAEKKGDKESPYFCPVNARLKQRENLIGLDERASIRLKREAMSSIRR